MAISTSIVPRSGNNSSPGSENCDCIVEVLCYDKSKEAPCGANTTIDVEGFFLEIDSKVGDARISLIGKVFQKPGQSVIGSETWKIEGQNVLGQGINLNSQSYWDISDLLQRNWIAGRNIKSITMSSVSSTVKRITIKGNINIVDIDNVQYGDFLGFFKDISGIQYNVKEIWFYRDAMSNLKQLPDGVTFDYHLDWVDFVRASDQLWHDQTVYKLVKQQFLKPKTAWKSYFQHRVSNDIELKFTYEIEFNNNCDGLKLAVLVRVHELHHPTSLQDVPVLYPIKLQVTPA